MNSIFCFDDFELDCGAFMLRHAGEPVRVDVLVLRVLQILVRCAGELRSKEQLIAEAWNGRVATDNALTVAIARVRKLLREYGLPRESVLTVHGRGYLFTRRVVVQKRAPELAALVELSSPEFVGREQAMLQLTAALAYAVNGSGRLVALRGEPGIGKTRVVEMFAQYAECSGCAVSWARCCEQADMPPLWPFAQLLRELMSTQPSVSGCDPAPELTTLLASCAEHVAGSVKPREIGARHQVFDAIACLLGGVEQATTRVLIIDDLQDADEASLQLLRYLLPTLGRMRILLVATLRSVQGDAVVDSTLSAALVHRHCVRITLGPLSELDVSSHVVARFGAVEHALSRRIYELSGGNPFSMVELLRQLEGHVVDAAQLSVPALTRELVRERLAVLDDDARDVLTYAALIGRVFWLPLLAAVVGRTTVALMATLDSAGAAKIVQAVAGSATEFQFAHGLFCAALYDEQGPAQRRLRHLRMARILEQRRAFAEVSHAQIAHHVRCSLPDGDLSKNAEAACATRPSERSALVRTSLSSHSTAEPNARC